jgi:hypothetical protein
MKKCPEIGTRVWVPPSLISGAYRGTVTAIYPTYEYDEIAQRETDKILPEWEWHVAVKVDVIPDRWPYPGTDLIAPEVKSLWLLKSS